jgi:VanZ family protein
MQSTIRLWRLAFGALLLIVLALSLLPLGPEMPSTGWDKTNHLLAFSMLGCLGCLAFPERIRAVLLGLLLYGALIEVLQSFTSYRFAEWGDLLADAIGLLPGWAMARLVGRFFAHR